MKSITEIVKSFRERFAVEYHDEMGEVIHTELTTFHRTFLTEQIAKLEGRKSQLETDFYSGVNVGIKIAITELNADLEALDKTI